MMHTNMLLDNNTNQIKVNHSNTQLIDKVDDVSDVLLLGNTASHLIT